MKSLLLHVFPNFKVGGAQVRFAMLAERLGPRFSHAVVAIDGNRTAASILPANADVAFAESPPARPFLGARLKSYHDALRALAPDILVTYNWGAIEWALANTILRIPHIHMEDGFGPDEVDHQLTRRVWTRRVALRRSAVVVPSLALRDIALRVWKLNASRVKYIPNAVAPHDSYSTPLESLGLDLPPDLPRIVWAGALRREKNLSRLLRAFAPVRQNAVLLVIGDGPERQSVVQEAQDLSLLPHIRFLGHRADARDIIMQCDIMALSSDTEQMPFAVLEAMDAGLAVASVDVGDVRHMVAAENHPFVVGQCANALGTAIAALAADPGMRAGIGLANQRRLRGTYDIRTMIAEYEKLFDAMTARSSSARYAHG